MKFSLFYKFPRNILCVFGLTVLCAFNGNVNANATSGSFKITSNKPVSSVLHGSSGSFVVQNRINAEETNSKSGNFQMLSTLSFSTTTTTTPPTPGGGSGSSGGSSGSGGGTWHGGNGGRHSYHPEALLYGIATTNINFDVDKDLPYFTSALKRPDWYYSPPTPITPTKPKTNPTNDIPPRNDASQKIEPTDKSPTTEPADTEIQKPTTETIEPQPSIEDNSQPTQTPLPVIREREIPRIFSPKPNVPNDSDIKTNEFLLKDFFFSDPKTLRFSPKTEQTLSWISPQKNSRMIETMNNLGIFYPVTMAGYFTDWEQRLPFRPSIYTDRDTCNPKVFFASAEKKSAENIYPGILETLLFTLLFLSLSIISVRKVRKS